MEDNNPSQQLVIADSSANHGKDGRFRPGNNASPGGRNGKSVWQPYGKRIQHWQTNYTLGDLLRISRDKKALLDLSAIDAACIKQILGSVHGDDVIKEREFMLDRIEGKPKQTIETITPLSGDEKSVYENIEEAERVYAEQMRRAAIPEEVNFESASQHEPEFEEATNGI